MIRWSSARIGREASLDRVTAIDPVGPGEPLERAALRSGLGGVAAIFLVVGGLAAAGWWSGRRVR